MNLDIHADELEIDHGAAGWFVFSLRTSPRPTNRTGSLCLFGTQAERLHLMSEWLGEEMKDADLSDPSIIKPLSTVIHAVAEALGIEISHRDPGPPSHQDTTPTANGLMDLVFGKKAQ